MSTNTHTPGARIVRHMKWDEQDEALRRLPENVRHFVLYDAIGDFHLASFLKHVRKVGSQNAMQQIRERQAQLTARAYGDHHPQANQGA